VIHTHTDIPEPDGDDPKEVYAFYGLAMYTAQLLEHSLLNLAAGLYLKDKPHVTRQLFDAAFESLDEKTLRQLLKAARALKPFPHDIDVALQDALSKRNYLTHQFFRTHASAFNHENGRKFMEVDTFHPLRLARQRVPLALRRWCCSGPRDHRCSWRKRRHADPNRSLAVPSH
jgi:hypothetical protein